MFSFNFKVISLSLSLPLSLFSPPLSLASSVQLNSGFLKIVQTTGTITLITFKINLRTRSSNAMLAQFGSHASLELRRGSVVYRRRHNATLGYTALTLAANAFINDGIWHHVRLDLSDTSTQVCKRGAQNNYVYRSLHWCMVHTHTHCTSTKWKNFGENFKFG